MIFIYSYDFKIIQFFGLVPILLKQKKYFEIHPITKFNKLFIIILAIYQGYT